MVPGRGAAACNKYLKTEKALELGHGQRLEERWSDAGKSQDALEVQVDKNDVGEGSGRSAVVPWRTQTSRREN